MNVEIDIVGRFGSSGIDLEGTSASLIELAERVQRSEGHETLELSIPSAPASPYSGYLRSLQIEIGEGSVQILRDHDRLYIKGTPEKIEILAENIASLASQKSSYSVEHLHIEYFPGHFYLTEGSEPLVLTRREAVA